MKMCFFKGSRQNKITTHVDIQILVIKTRNIRKIQVFFPQKKDYIADIALHEIFFGLTLLSVSDQLFTYILVADEIILFDS